jgi:cell division protein FtsI (penicillin-binding protein 3)
MAFGYGVHITPMQTLALYAANDGEMVKPQFVSEIKVE